jgi:hypothetical protein
MTAELEKFEATRAYLLATFERITAGASRVILMVGSNRQSMRLDQWNRAGLESEIGAIPDDVGLVRDDFESLAAKMGWELNKCLLADQANGVPPGTAWEDGSKDYKFLLKGRDKLVKKQIVEYQLSLLRGTAGLIDFYFFDDKSEYLNYAREELAKDGKIPSSVIFSTVHFDWFSHVIEEVALDLKAVGTSGQPRYLNRVGHESLIDFPHLLGGENIFPVSLI